MSKKPSNSRLPALRHNKMDPEKPDQSAKRLCSEIQLFDLCDLDSCSHKNGRFCTNEKLLAKFESIREEADEAKLVYSEDEDDEDGQDEYDENFDDFDYEEDD